MPGVVGCRQIAAGQEHTCALTGDGSILCWGRNHRGQTGAPASPFEPRPLGVAGVGAATAIALGSDSSCALGVGGHVYCWGGNDQGNLGDGTTVARAAPAAVHGVDDAVELALGRYAGCVRRATGAVLCWGVDRSIRESIVRLEPTALPALDGSRSLAVGTDFICGIRAGGRVGCLGVNRFGQLGVERRPAARDHLAIVPNLSGVYRLVAGSVHACARHEAGIACWGLNQTGQLGDGSTHDRPHPVSVAGFGR